MRTWSRVLIGFLWGVAGCFLLDGLIFKSGFYSRFLSPDSASGRFELILRTELERPKNSGKQVVTVGDSRMAFLARVANEATVGSGFTFATASAPGTTPRCWYYALRDLDPAKQRYSAILLPVDSYQDIDSTDNLADRLTDLTYLAARLRLTDTLEFAGSIPSPSLRWKAFRDCLFRGALFKLDVQDFLANPPARIDALSWARTEWRQFAYNAPGDSRSLAGLSVDWTTRKISYPAGIDPGTRGLVEASILWPDYPSTGQARAYRKEWFGRIIDRYRGSRTRLIFLRLPRGPVPLPRWFTPKPTASILEFQSRPNVIVMDEHAFDELERPELFFNPPHLNAEGSARFSRMLAERVRALI